MSSKKSPRSKKSQKANQQTRKSERSPSGAKSRGGSAGVIVPDTSDYNIAVVHEKPIELDSMCTSEKERRSHQS
jgi:hypothetical protein